MLLIIASQSILRELGENYTYSAFQKKLDECKKSFNPQQLAGLEQRMALLRSFIDKKGYNKHPRFAPGQLTIIDLSDPFIDPAAASGLFEIITRLFVRADVGTGKVLVVDEAHKVPQLLLILNVWLMYPESICRRTRSMRVSRRPCCH